MAFKLSRKSKKQLKKLAKANMFGLDKIEQHKNQFWIDGYDNILRTRAGVGVRVNKRGKIKMLDMWSLGATLSEIDDQYVVFKVKNPEKTIKWFSKRASPEESLPFYYEVSQSTARLFADTYDSHLPGLKGGTDDVYVYLGGYTALA